MAQEYFDGLGGNSHKYGPGQVGPKLGILKEEATQRGGNVGLAKVMGDGRCFIYSHFVSAVTVGKLVAADASVAHVAKVDAGIVDSGGTIKDDYGTDDSTIYLKNAALTSDDAADVFADGYLRICDAAGEGYQYKIKSNGKGAATAATTMRFDLYDNLELALDSESSWSVQGNTYRNLAINNHNVDANAVGVTSRSMTAAYFGWVQSWGPAYVLVDESAGTAGIGTIAQVSDAVDGAAQPFGGGATDSEDDHLYATSPIVGFFAEAGVDTEYSGVFLQLRAC